MLDPIFSSADLFLRDVGPRRHSLGGSNWAERHRFRRPSYPEQDIDLRRR